MTPEKRAKLEAAGVQVYDDPDQWFDAVEVEHKIIALRATMGSEVKRKRSEAKMTQDALAKRIGSSRARISNIESVSPEIGLDLAFRAFFAVGGKVEELAGKA